jgi:hypothetical protein
MHHGVASRGCIMELCPGITYSLHKRLEYAHRSQRQRPPSRRHYIHPQLQIKFINQLHHVFVTAERSQANLNHEHMNKMHRYIM